MDANAAGEFVRKHGVVLRSARGPVPNLAEAIAGAPIRGSWWAHPKAHDIFRVFGAICESDQVLVCRLVDGKVTLVHRRLWPALVRLAPSLPKRALAAVREEHTPRGYHRVVETPFPRWVPRDVLDRARQMDEDDAASQLGVELFAHIRGARATKRLKTGTRHGE